MSGPSLGSKRHAQQQNETYVKVPVSREWKWGLRAPMFQLKAQLIDQQMLPSMSLVALSHPVYMNACRKRPAQLDT